MSLEIRNIKLIYNDIFVCHIYLVHCYVKEMNKLNLQIFKRSEISKIIEKLTLFYIECKIY